MWRVLCCYRGWTRCEVVGSLLVQFGEGQAGQENLQDILEERFLFLNLSSGDVAHAVLEADASVGEINTGLI